MPFGVGFPRERGFIASPFDRLVFFLGLDHIRARFAGY
jgi:hypothetical protein